MLRRLAYGTSAALFAVLLVAAPAFAAPTKESVGRKLYFDTSLSNPKGQSCASCHDPGAGFADPDQDLPVSAGIIPGRFGNRNSPTSAYAYLIPPFHFDDALGEYVGGQFWDGRASTLKDQAKGPFLNPLEMNMPNAAAVVHRVEKSKYAKEFQAVYGRRVFSDPKIAYDRIADAIAAYESSDEVNPFSSKHDLAMSRTGQARMQTFTMQERRGMMLFNGQGKCSTCHPGAMMMGGGMGGGGGGMGGGGGGGGMGGGGMGGGGGGMGGGGMGGGGGGGGMMTESAFSDFRYDNLGIPANPANPFYELPRKFNPEGLLWVDHGLGGVLGDPEYDGMFRVPTLRNVELTAPYGHNGYFATLKEIVHFYNTRDVPGAGWDPAEVPATVNHAQLGNLGLTSAQEDDIVAFLKTLTDGYW